VTMILGIVDTGTGGMVYGQGGHNPPLLVPVRGKPTYEPAGGMPLGVFEDAKFGERELQLKPGETLLVYTDGVTEAMNGGEDLVGGGRLEKRSREWKVCRQKRSRSGLSNGWRALFWRRRGRTTSLCWRSNAEAS